MENPNGIIKRVSLDELRSDMVVADDISTKDGHILIKRNTILNETKFNLLLENNIKYVYVQEKSINLDKPVLSNVQQSAKRIPITEQKEFKEFEEIYSEKTDELKKSLIAIGEGELIDISTLFELTDGIMSKMKCKGDVFSYLSFLKTKDEHTFSHSNNVALLCNIFSTWLGYDEEQSLILTTAGILHDIGKTQVPPEILNKTGPLTVEEFNEIKKHTLYGYRLLEKRPDIPQDVKLAALVHHEKIDGSGYPIGIHGEKINSISKIVSICDIYDAMTADRIYREKICPFEVIKSFEQRSFGELDTKFLFVFLQNIAYNYIGSFVELSDGRIAEVVFINRAHLSQPIVRCDNEMIDLSVNRNIKIMKIV